MPKNLDLMVSNNIGLLKKPSFDWPIWLKGNSKRTSSNSLMSVEGPEQGSRCCFAEVTNRGQITFVTQIT